MNLLILGNGKGSWTVRGVQLGAALGARVTSRPTEADWQWADRVILVKNHGAVFAPNAHRRGLPIVWDALDFWSQPRDNRVSDVKALALLQAQIKVIKPARVICATEAMAEACDGVYLPHHAWAGLTPTPAREHVSVVGYEGNPLYLGAWHDRLLDACEKRGWLFVLNPTDLRAVDLFVSLREGPWDGWICRQWKSGVKVVNAMAAGRPVLTQPTAAFREINPVGSAIDDPQHLDVALDRLATKEVRDDAVAQSRVITVDDVAARYRLILQSVEARCAA